MIPNASYENYQMHTGPFVATVANKVFQTYSVWIRSPDPNMAISG